MTDVLLASTEADASAATAIEQHHAELSAALVARVEALLSAAGRGGTAAALTARDELVRWCEQELVPHATAEEESLYPAAQRMDRGRLLIDGMLAEHTVIVGLVRELGAGSDPVRLAGAARALEEVFAGHLDKENGLILPLLSQAPEVSLAALLEGMHEHLGGGQGHDSGPAAGGCGCGGSSEVQGHTDAHGHAHDHAHDHAHGHAHGHAQGHGAGGHTCACGEFEPAGYPELDARSVPHAIRHATIFGALGSVAPGGGLVLVAPHDPLPLLTQIEQRWPGAFEVRYLERGPEAWRLSFVRTA